MSLKGFIEICHNNFVGISTDQDVEVARQYLKERKLLESSWDIHKIGFCSKDFNIPDSVRFYGSEDEKKKWDLSSYISGRIIVPIYSEFGDLEGFATRKPFFGKEHTWWNLPFPKGNHLFLINLARKHIFKLNKVYVVEGYMDALMLYQAGLKNVVCIMGTALTQRKIATIARYCNEVCFCFDVDKNESGQKATARSIGLIKKVDFCEKISIIDGLPVGDDPADYVKKHGLECFLNLERELKQKEIMQIILSLKKK